MREKGLARYLLSCGVLTVPILVWNVACTRFLPPALASSEFSRNIPPLVTYGENTLRIVVMVLPFLMPLEVATGGQRRGLLLFAVGTRLYFLAWVPLMLSPQSRWSTSWLGFVAPAYTPLVWLAGLGLIGRRLWVPWPFKWWMYVGLAFGFVALHVTHASIVYARNHQQRAAVEETSHFVADSGPGRAYIDELKVEFVQALTDVEAGCVRHDHGGDFGHRIHTHHAVKSSTHALLVRETRAVDSLGHS